MKLTTEEMTAEELLQTYLEHLTDKVIEGAGIFDDEIVIFLDDKSEVCIWSENGSLAIQVNERQEFDD